MAISKKAEAAREGARQKTGQFGHQAHAEAQIDLTAPTFNMEETFWGTVSQFNLDNPGTGIEDPSGAGTLRVAGPAGSKLTIYSRGITDTRSLKEALVERMDNFDVDNEFNQVWNPDFARQEHLTPRSFLNILEHDESFFRDRAKKLRASIGVDKQKDWPRAKDTQKQHQFAGEFTSVALQDAHMKLDDEAFADGNPYDHTDLDFSPHAKEQLEKYAATFYAEHEGPLSAIGPMTGGDLYMSASGSGVGFQDRDYIDPQVAKRLDSETGHSMEGASFYVADGYIEVEGI